MTKLLAVLGTLLAVVGGLVFFSEHKGNRRAAAARVSSAQAAELLRQAWADNHTVA